MAMFLRMIGSCADCGGRGTIIRPLWRDPMISCTMECVTLGRPLGGNYRGMRRVIHKEFTKNPKFENPEMAATQSGGGGEGDGSVTIELLRKKLEDFANERGWLPHHSPRNLLLALVGEVGELSEIFQWKGEVKRGIPEWKEEEKLHLGEELSDVLLYLIQLSDSCGIDLSAAALRKLHLNSLKYPPPPQPSADNASNNSN